MDNGLNEIPLDHYSTISNRKDRHHIFPSKLLSNYEVASNQINSICNVCLLTAEENQEIGFRRPRSYLGEVRDNGTYFKRKMVHHLIPVGDESGIWLTNVRRGFSRFMRERAEMIVEALENEAGIPLFRRET